MQTNGTMMGLAFQPCFWARTEGKYCFWLHTVEWFILSYNNPRMQLATNPKSLSSSLKISVRGNIAVKYNYFLFINATFHSSSL